MLALLRELRRERNGAVADSMRYYGTPYGLNYGVSLPTLRRIARAEAPDHGFARYLYRQDVRELRLAALHIACPACLTPEEFPAWAAGIVNSEIAEEAAFALLSRAEAFPAVLGVDRLARCVVAVCRPARRRAQSPPYGLMGCTGRRSRAPQCNGRGDGRNAGRSDDRGDRRRNFRRCGYLCCTECLCL